MRVVDVVDDREHIFGDRGGERALAVERERQREREREGCVVYFVVECRAAGKRDPRRGYLCTARGGRETLKGLVGRSDGVTLLERAQQKVAVVVQSATASVFGPRRRPPGGRSPGRRRRAQLHRVREAQQRTALTLRLRDLTWAWTSRCRSLKHWRWRARRAVGRWNQGRPAGGTRSAPVAGAAWPVGARERAQSIGLPPRARRHTQPLTMPLTLRFLQPTRQAAPSPSAVSSLPL